MKTRSLIILLLMMMAYSAIFASEDPNENEEYWRKTQELNVLAERFKAETGFEGSFTYRYTDTKISQINGKFSDIKVVAYNDTTYMRQVFEVVLNKIIPYLSAKENQLIRDRIEISPVSANTKYTQIINGYHIITGGNTLSITYLPNKDIFIITDSSSNISTDSVPILVSKDEAKIKLIDAYERSEFYNIDLALHMKGPDIGYATFLINGKICAYRLYWYMTFWNHAFYIDVETSEIIDRPLNSFHNNTYSISGKTYRPTSMAFLPTNPPEKPMEGISVTNGSESGSTNEFGIVTFSYPPDISYEVKLENTRSRIESWNAVGVLSVNNCTLTGPLNYETIISDLIPIGNLNSEYAANIYYHLVEQDKYFRGIYPGFHNMPYPTIHNDCSYLPNGSEGMFLPAPNLSIGLVNGLNPYSIRHELSHFFTYKKMTDHMLSDDLNNPANEMIKESMDEAFAEYWLTRGINSTARRWMNNPYDISFYDVSLVHADQNFNPQSLPLNEEFYSWYHNRMPIASAWDIIRLRLGALSSPQNFDLILLSVLSTVDNGNLERYKPRYYYNLLMAHTDLDAQKIISEEYSNWGLNFNPTIESISSANKAKNYFGLNEPVHVKISDCPQNTRINIYVINHGSYTYTDGALVTGLSSFYANGFSPITNVTTGPTGEWSGLIWTTPSSAADAVGDYDIIVDIGSPDTPDGIIHFAFSGANVMDGFDGRTKPGLSVIDNGIDVVMAVSAFSEPQVSKSSK